jgi:hypothetical protein
LKRLFSILGILAIGFAVACEGTTDPPVTTQGRLSVLVEYDDQGLPGRQIEVLETGVSRDTDAQGFARFTLPPGEYTVRAYGINVGGPSVQYVDTPVTIQAGKKTDIKIFDCLPCV